MLIHLFFSEWMLQTNNLHSSAINGNAQAQLKCFGFSKLKIRDSESNVVVLKAFVNFKPKSFEVA